MEDKTLYPEIANITKEKSIYYQEYRMLLIKEIHLKRKIEKLWELKNQIEFDKCYSELAEEQKIIHYKMNEIIEKLLANE